MAMRVLRYQKHSSFKRDDPLLVGAMGCPYGANARGRAGDTHAHAYTPYVWNIASYTHTQ